MRPVQLDRFRIQDSYAQYPPAEDRRWRGYCPFSTENQEENLSGRRAPGTWLFL